jgi:CysZ protein
MTHHIPPCPTCGYPPTDATCTQCSGKIVAVDGVTTIQAGNRFFAAELLEGFMSLFHATLLLMTKKEFMGKLGLACFVNFVFVTAFAGGTFYGFWALLHALLDDYIPSGWWAGSAVVATIAIILAMVATWFLAPTLIQAGLTPFLDPIANATERMLGGEGMKPVEIGMWRSLLAGLNAASQILVIQIFILVPVLLLGMVPVVNLVAVPLGIAVSAFLNAVVWFEIPVLRRGYGMTYRRRLLRKNWARALGFGLAFNVGMLVPFFNILFLGPATAVAVSMLYFRFDKRVPPN